VFDAVFDRYGSHFIQMIKINNQGLMTLKLISLTVNKPGGDVRKKFCSIGPGLSNLFSPFVSTKNVLIEIPKRTGKLIALIRLKVQN